MVVGNLPFRSNTCHRKFLSIFLITQKQTSQQLEIEIEYSNGLLYSISPTLG